MADTGFDAVVLAGGGAHRLGGTDKPAIEIGGRSLLERVLEATAEAGVTVVVGPQRRTSRPVRWTREDPPGGGPVAAIAAGTELTTAPTVVVLAGDLPLVTTRTVARLTAAMARADDGVGLLDAGRQQQPLAAAYRRDRLCAVLGRLGDVRGLAMRTLTGELRLTWLPATSEETLDVDDWADLARARNLLEGR